MFEAECVAPTGPIKIGDRVAIKEILRSVAKTRDDDFSILLSSNSLPNCVKCLAVFTDSATGRPHLVFELCPGGDLAAFLRKTVTSIDEGLLIAWFAQLLQALVAMAAKGVTHDDIALRNLLLLGRSNTSMRSIRVADFGIAQFTHCAGSSPREAYSGVAPEAAAGGKPNSASDAWSLGVVMLQLITRDVDCVRAALAVESKGDSKRDAGEAQLHAMIAAHQGKYASRLLEAVARLLVFDPKQRASARDVLAMLKPVGETAQEALLFS